MRYVKSRIFTVTNIHSGHVTIASIETSLQTKKTCISLTENNAKLIKRIVKKIGKTNLFEFISVSGDNLSKVDERKKNQESLWDYAVCFCEWVKANTVLHNLTSCVAPPPCSFYMIVQWWSNE